MFSEGDRSPISAGEAMCQTPNFPRPTTLMTLNECAEDKFISKPIPMA